MRESVGDGHTYGRRWRSEWNFGRVENEGDFVRRPAVASLIDTKPTREPNTSTDRNATIGLFSQHD